MNLCYRCLTWGFYGSVGHLQEEVIRMSNHNGGFFMEKVARVYQKFSYRVI